MQTAKQVKKAENEELIHRLALSHKEDKKIRAILVTLEYIVTFSKIN